MNGQDMNSGAAGSNAVSPALIKLGSILGLLGVIFWTPTVFNATKAHVTTYLTDLWGLSASPWLVWTVGFLQAFWIFWTIKLIVVAFGTWLVMGISRIFGR